MLKYALALGQAKILLSSLDDKQTSSLQNVVKGVISARVIDPNTQPLLSEIADVVLTKGSLSENIDEWVTSSGAINAVTRQKELNEAKADFSPSSFMCPHCDGITDLEA